MNNRTGKQGDLTYALRVSNMMIPFFQILFRKIQLFVSNWSHCNVYLENVYNFAYQKWANWSFQQFLGYFNRFQCVSLREKCPCLMFVWSVFTHIRTEYGPAKLRIRTLFTQCVSFMILFCISLFHWKTLKYVKLHDPFSPRFSVYNHVSLSYKLQMIFWWHFS